MKRRRESDGKLRYDTGREEYLGYGPPTSDRQDRYAKAVVEGELPLGNKALLCQLTEFLLFIEELTDAVYERVREMGEEDEDEEEDGVVDYGKMIRDAVAKLSRGESTVTSPTVHTVTMMGVAWRWHNEICERGRPIPEQKDRQHEAMTGLYAHCFMLSWTAFCKLFHLSIYENRDLYRSIRTQRAEQYAYCKQVSEKENVIISQAPLLSYTVNEVWNSLQQIVPSLYVHPFTPDMKTYLYALFFRYCDILCTKQVDLRRIMDNPLFVKFQKEELSQESDVDDTEEDSEEDEDSDEESDEDDDEEEAYDAYKRVNVPLDETCSLRSAYLYEGQLAFFSQLKRILLSERLAQLQEGDPLILEEALTEEGTVDGKESFTEFVRVISLHPVLKGFVKEGYMRTVISLSIYHGETERYRMRWPYAACQPMDVLSIFRPNDNMTAMRALTLTAEEILADQTLYEKNAVLITKFATLAWLSSKGEQKAMQTSEKECALAGCFIMEELVSLNHIDEMVASLDSDGVGMPILLRMVRLYYVIRGTSIYRTPHFVEAYLLWLSLLVQDGFILRKNIHPKVKSCLDYFIVADS